MRRVMWSLIVVLLQGCGSHVALPREAPDGGPHLPDCIACGGFVHPGVVYTQDAIDAWSTSSPEYDRLRSTGAASLTRVPWAFGTQIDSGGRTCTDCSGTCSTCGARCTNCDLNTGFKDQSGYAKVQAVLWAADGNSARRDKVIAYLQEYRSVTSFEWDVVEQYRLVAGWACTNLAQAAEIIDYQDDQFRRFLRDVCYPIMDWTGGPNWHASFADSKLAIAAYLGDAELWADAKAYFYERIRQSIFHATYDGTKVFPLHTEDTKTTNPDGTSTVPPRLHAPPGTPNLGRTRGHWGGGLDPEGKGQINDDYTLNTKYGAPVNGTNAERLRDLGHVNMGLGAWMHGLRTLEAQGESGTAAYQEAFERLRAAYAYHSQRVLTYAQTGVFPAPVPVQGDGGGARFQGYYGAQELFGAATPNSVLDMLARDEVKSYAAGGANHLVAEAFAD